MAVMKEMEMCGFPRVSNRGSMTIGNGGGMDGVCVDVVEQENVVIAQT
jgi:hypothetical protein